MKTGKNRRKELQNVWMNFSPTHWQKPERQCTTTVYHQSNMIFHRQKIYIIVFIINFVLLKSGFFQAKKYLACHQDRWPAVRYFEPCHGKLLPVCFFFFTITSTVTVLMSISVEISWKILLLRKRKKNCNTITSFPWSVLLLNIAVNQSPH